MNFNKDSENIIVIMYPTGGYGNFLYKVLTDYLEHTVKIEDPDFTFSESGNSHKSKKYTEIFDLGSAYYEKRLKTFSYDYRILDETVLDQIQMGKLIVVLADTGNLGDNVNFIRRYFPHAKIIRIYAESFKEKFIVWQNCVNKVLLGQNNLYKDSLQTKEGIAKFVNKHPDNITDNDAVASLANFLIRDFEQFGKNYSKKVEKEYVFNFPISSFFYENDFLNQLSALAIFCNSKIISKHKLRDLFLAFYSRQNFIDPDIKIVDNTIVSQALEKYYAAKNN